MKISKNIKIFFIISIIIFTLPVFVSAQNSQSSDNINGSENSEATDPYGGVDSVNPFNNKPTFIIDDSLTDDNVNEYESENERLQKNRDADLDRASRGSGLVPCGFTSPTSCGIEDLGRLILNVINFLITISLTLSVLILAAAGINYMTAAGDSNKIQGSIRMFKNFGIGLLISLSAFLIVQLIANSLGLDAGIWQIVNSFFAN